MSHIWSKPYHIFHAFLDLELLYFQWQNESLVKTIYPLREMKLRDFLYFYQEIELWKEYKDKPLSALETDIRTHHEAQAKLVREAVSNLTRLQEYFLTPDVRPVYATKYPNVDDAEVAKINLIHASFGKYYLFADYLASMILHTPRLLLRPFASSDGPAIHAYASDPEVVTHMEWGPNTLEDTRHHLQEVLKNQSPDEKQNFPFAVVLRADPGTAFVPSNPVQWNEGRTPFLDGKLVGSCHLFVEHPDIREAWIGYVLTRHYWGQGIMTEAARALLQFGFGELGLHRIYATCRPENLGSQRVLEKIGMTREGHLRQHKWMKGQWRDSYLYAILAEEFTKEQRDNAL